MIRNYFTVDRLRDLWRRVENGNYIDKIQMLNYISDFMNCSKNEAAAYMKEHGINIDLGRAKHGGKNGHAGKKIHHGVEYHGAGVVEKPVIYYNEIFNAFCNRYGCGADVTLKSQCFVPSGAQTRREEYEFHKWRIVEVYPYFFRCSRKAGGRTIYTTVNIVGFWLLGTNYIV